MVALWIAQIKRQFIRKYNEPKDTEMLTIFGVLVVDWSSNEVPGDQVHHAHTLSRLLPLSARCCHLPDRRECTQRAHPAGTQVSTDPTRCRNPSKYRSNMLQELK